MAVLTEKCPHCLTQHIGMIVVAVSGIRGAKEACLFLQCPKCNLPASTVITWDKTSLSFEQLPSHNGELSVFGFRPASLWPAPPGPEIPDHLPPDVGRIYLQAERNFSIPGNEEAAGIMYRKALDVGVAKIDPNLKGTLAQKIKALQASGRFTADIAEWAHTVRAIGNDAAHDEESLTRAELDDLRHFTEMVMRYLFTLPQMVALNREAARKAKEADQAVP